MKQNILHLSAMMIAWVLSALVPVCADAQDSDLKPGMYYLSPNGPQLIEKQTSSSSNSSSFGVSQGGFSAGFTTDLKRNFSGAEAEVKTSTTPEFLFVYNPKAKSVMVNYNVFNCKQTSDPNLAVLIRLDQSKTKRTLDVGQCDWYSVDTLIIQPLDEHRYQLRTLHPLPQGEYGFFFQMPSIGNMLIPQPDYTWPFSVKEE